MALRRTSVSERIAGDVLGFSTAEKLTESESVLSKYFPELSLRISAKTSRGSRLGRAPQTSEQVTTYTPRELTTYTPRETQDSAKPSYPDYSGQIAELKSALLQQSELLRKLSEQRAGSTVDGNKPTGSVPSSPSQQAEKEITQIYKNVLGREPDVEGFRYWMGEGRAAGGITPEEKASLERDFRLSPEYNVNKLYREELGRTPDKAGFEYWTKQDPRMTGGVDPQEYKELQQAFRESPEYKKLQEGGPKIETVQQAYQETFGRAADPEGLKYWSSAGNAPTLGGLKEALAASAKAQPTGEDRIRLAYREALGRDPDAEGLKYWSTSSGTATDYEALKNQLLVAAGKK